MPVIGFSGTSDIPTKRFLTRAGLITANRTLGGAVEWAQPGSAGFEDVEFEGAATARAASISVTLFFTAAATPLS